MFPEREVAQAAEVERCEREVSRLRQENVLIVGEMRSLQAQLTESTEAVEAAHRLSDQLDRKEELISALREEGRLGGGWLGEGEKGRFRCQGTVSLRPVMMLNQTSHPCFKHILFNRKGLRKEWFLSWCTLR